MIGFVDRHHAGEVRVCKDCLMVAKSLVTDSAIQHDMNGPRVDVRRLLKVLLLSMLLPLGAMIVLDYFVGTWPFLTIISLAVILPIGTLLTSRAALTEMNKVIAEVAPPDDDDVDRDMIDAEIVETDESSNSSS